MGYLSLQQRNSEEILDQGWVPDLVQYPHNVLCADDEIGNLCSSLDIETHKISSAARITNTSTFW